MFKQYQQIQTLELRPYLQNEDTSNITISQVDKDNNSPKQGDMIARTSKYDDQEWLINEEQFKKNFIDISQITNGCELQETGVRCLNQLLQGKEIEVSVKDINHYDPSKIKFLEKITSNKITMKVARVWNDYSDYHLDITPLDTSKTIIDLDVWYPSVEFSINPNQIETIPNKKLMPVIGKTYNCFDDGKVTTSELYQVVITDIIPFEQADNELIELWNRNVEDCDWLFKNTDYFIKYVSTSNKEEPEADSVFARTIDGDWFSLGGWYECGLLDVDGTLFQSITK
jgi:hypothetical protein